MSSTLHSPQQAQSSKQWWARASTKSSTISLRASKTPPNIQTHATSKSSSGYEEKLTIRTTMKPTKFNTFASVIGFKSKKSSPILAVPPGPASPPLPFQSPPSHQSTPARSHYTSGTSYGPRSPVTSSIYNTPSEEDALEPLTPSDKSRYRTSYQPSLLQFTEQDQKAGVGYADSLGARYMSPDSRRISVMSDPSIIDPHLKGHCDIRVSATSSYYPPSQVRKSFPGKSSNTQSSRTSSMERRRSSIEGRISKEIDTVSSVDSSMHRKSIELRSRNYRSTDNGKAALPKSSTSMSPLQGHSLSKIPAPLVIPKTNPSLRSPSPSLISGSLSGNGVEGSISRTEKSKSGKREAAEVRNEREPLNNGISLPSDTFPPPSSARLMPSVRPKASSVSNSSISGSSTGGGGARVSPTVGMSASSSPSLSRTASVNSGPGSISSVSIHRQTSASRMRSVPPSRTPPPTADLPPTPGSRPPSPLTFRSPKNGSTSSLLNSPISVMSDDPSILMFDLPPSTPSSESASSVSLVFANPGPKVNNYDMNRAVTSPIPPTRNGRYDFRVPPQPSTRRMYKDDYRPVTQPSHGQKSSQSSNNTLMGVRGDTPTPRTLKKSVSQQSINANLNIGGTRPRMDSTASMTTEESLSMQISGGVKSLRKQRSLHNARVSSTDFVPPLPQQLRHASSFNTSSVLNDLPSVHSHVKHDSVTSVIGFPRRPGSSSTPPSTTNSVISTPTTPQAQKKRMLFSSHGVRDRRDSNNNQVDRESSLHGVDASHTNDRKKLHSSPAPGIGMGLGLFTGHFSPGASTSVDPPHGSRPPSPPIEDSLSPQLSRVSMPNVPPPSIDQHILPPKELLSQMEALADTQAPTSPPQFSNINVDSDDDKEWALDITSFIDRRSVSSRVGSISGASISLSQSGDSEPSIKSNPSSPTMTTRHFVSANRSIQERLQGNRPSTASRVQNPHASSRSSSLKTIPARPSTAQTFGVHSSSEQFSPARGELPLGQSSRDQDFKPKGLPPPPRRKVIVTSSPQRDDGEQILDMFSGSPASNAISPLPQWQPNLEPSNASRNPKRISVFRKPSFLDIGDDFGEPLSSLPEDSFLILEKGKDSLDISRAFANI